MSACNAGYSDCNGVAADGCEYDDADFATDTSNCGGCGTICAAPNGVSSCDAGSCGLDSCASGFHDVDGDPANGCECELLSSTDGTCDGVDDDCDGVSDEDFVATVCGQGACEASSTCVAGAEQCTPGTPETDGGTGGATADSGCSCDTTGRPGSSAGGGLILLLGLGLLLWRRRKAALIEISR